MQSTKRRSMPCVMSNWEGRNPRQSCNGYDLHCWSIIWWCLFLYAYFFCVSEDCFVLFEWNFWCLASSYWKLLIVECQQYFFLLGRSLRFSSDFAGFIWNRRESRSDHGWKRYILTDINIYLACGIFLFWKLHVLLFIFLIFSFLPIIKDLDIYSILFQIRNNLTF